jgi:hypothetical protein
VGAVDPAPGKWTKYCNGAWSEPGVGGKSSPVDGLGVAYWTTTGKTIGFNWVKGGMGLVASPANLHSTAVLSQPLLLAEPGDWLRKNSLEVLSYRDAIDIPHGIQSVQRPLAAGVHVSEPRRGFC